MISSRCVFNSKAQDVGPTPVAPAVSSEDDEGAAIPMPRQKGNSNIQDEADGMDPIVMASAWSVFYLVMFVHSVVGYLFHN